MNVTILMGAAPLVNMEKNFTVYEKLIFVELLLVLYFTRRLTPKLLQSKAFYILSRQKDISKTQLKCKCERRLCIHIRKLRGVRVKTILATIKHQLNLSCQKNPNSKTNSEPNRRLSLCMQITYPREWTYLNVNYYIVHYSLNH